MVEVERRVVEQPVTVTARVPDGWSELEADGYVLLVGGDLGQPEGSLTPTLQVTLQQGGSADAIWEALTTGAGGLEDPHVVVELRRPLPEGEEQVLEVVHRGVVSGGTQLSIYRLLWLADMQLVLTVLGTCGGAAPEEVRDALRGIVASVTALRNDKE